MRIYKKGIDMLENIQALMATFAPDFNWYDYHGKSQEDLFRACITAYPTDIGVKIGCGCGSYEPKDTPSALYRLLYLVQPNNVNFSDMYKTFLFGFQSADRRFTVRIELYKYEIGLYFYAPKEAIKGMPDIVQGGWPGCDNGISLNDAEGEAWFAMIRAVVEYKWAIYPGNNFEV